MLMAVRPQHDWLIWCDSMEYPVAEEIKQVAVQLL